MRTARVVGHWHTRASAHATPPFPLCAPTFGLRCKSRSVRHRADALQVPTVVELNALGTFAKMLYSISYGYAARTMRSWYFDYSRSIPCYKVGMLHGRS
jgi:hypothetical protein